MKEKDNIYSGPALVEFIPAIKTRSVGTVASPGYDSVKVQLVGSQLSSPTELEYEVDPTSTAVSGQHYTIANPGKFAIPANSSFGYIRVDLVVGSVTGTATKLLVLNLKGNSTINASANYKTYKLTIAK
ncbi:MAG: hypothetical protein WBP45_11805 [Daejeonella sp.]